MWLTDGIKVAAPSSDIHFERKSCSRQVVMSAASLSFLALCLVLAASNTAHAQHDTHWWANRSTMVHLFEWKWSDIANECEQFLAPHGYAGVQVSPVTENVMLKDHPWYERYQPVSYKLHTRSGSEADFADMTRRCNKVGVRIYVDVVLNHMAADHHIGIVHGTNGSIADPEHLDFPAVPYTAKHFHSPCAINDYDNRFEVQNCELVGLRDLDQSSEFVRQQLTQHLSQLVELGVAGYRVDAAKHIAAEDLKVIYNGVRNLNTDHGFPPNSRPFVYQEVIDHGQGVISRDEYTSMGAVTEFRFSEEIGRAFRGHNQLKWLQSFGTAWGFMESKYAFVYVDNHDNQREHGEPLHYRDGKPYKMATAFALSFPFGINRVMSSYDFSVSSQPAPANADGSIKSPTFDEDGACTNGWVCEHRWRQIYNMVGFKNEVSGTKVNNWWDNGDNQIAFSRGDRGFIAFNGNSWDFEQRLQTCLAPGVYCDVISGSLINGNCTGKSVTVDASGFADITIGKDEFDGVLAIHTGAKITKNNKPKKDNKSRKNKKRSKF